MDTPAFSAWLDEYAPLYDENGNVLPENIAERAAILQGEHAPTCPHVIDSHLVYAPEEFVADAWLL